MKLPALNGNHITLRPFRQSDIQALQKHANDKIVSKFVPIIPHPYTRDDARNWINTAQRLAREDKAHHFAIVLHKIGEVIGMMSLKNINRHDTNAELEYWVNSKYSRRGIASEALKLILNYAFGNLKLRRVYAVVAANNVASVGLLEKFEFTREGEFRQAYRTCRIWVNVYCYGLLREEHLHN